MREPSTQPFLAFSLLLALLIGGGLVLQTLGNAFNLHLARRCLYLVLPPSLWLTYGYFFPLTKRHARVAIGMMLLLAILGLVSAQLWDFSPDGMGYQQPSAGEVLRGWNPLRGDGVMKIQNIFPAGVWEMEAAVAVLYGSIEAAKMLQLLWLCIALPVFLCGLSAYKGGLTRLEQVLAVLAVISPVVIGEMPTHYVDAMLALSGMTFLGALLLYQRVPEQRRLACVFMAASLLFMVNDKLSGIYHAAALCAAAVAFLWLKAKKFPWRMVLLLLLSGLAATLVIGYRPYVTSMLAYGRLLPDGQENFTVAQRPANLDALGAVERFAGSLFSATGGDIKQPVQLKFPWELRPGEWEGAGVPDVRNGGFGPFFALGLLAALLLFGLRYGRGRMADGGLVVLAACCLLSSACFPESWWARYVPLAYPAPLLLLLSLPAPAARGRWALAVVALLFFANSAVVAGSTWRYWHRTQARFADVVVQLRAQPPGAAYIVPPIADYQLYTLGHLALQRRLLAEGIDAPIRINVPCLHQVTEWVEFKICY